MATMKKNLDWYVLLATVPILIGLASFFAYNAYISFGKLSREDVIKYLSNAEKQQLSCCNNSYEIDKKVCSEILKQGVVLGCLEKHVEEGSYQESVECEHKADRMYQLYKVSVFNAASERLGIK